LEGNFSARWPVLAEQVGRVLAAGVSTEEEFVASDADQRAGVNLSSEARTMIVETAKDPHGRLLYVRTGSRTSFLAHGVNLCQDQSPRAVARWKAALDRLVEHSLLEPLGREGEVFALTASGFEIADLLRA
jgi:hypothetical protein